MKLNALNINDDMMFNFHTDVGEFIPKSQFTILDFQLYCIEEITQISINKIGYIMIAESIFMMFIAVLMLEQVSIADVWKLIKKY